MIRIHQQVTIEVSGSVNMLTTTETPERAKPTVVNELLAAPYGIAHGADAASGSAVPRKKYKPRKKSKK